MDKDIGNRNATVNESQALRGIALSLRSLLAKICTAAKPIMKAICRLIPYHRSLRGFGLET